MVSVVLFFIWKFRDWRNSSKAIAAVLVPFIVVVGSALTYFAILGGPGTLFESVVIFPLHYYPAGDANSPSIFFEELLSALPLRPVSVLLGALWLSVNAAVPVILIAFFPRWFRKNDVKLGNQPLNANLALYALAGTFAMLAAAGAPSSPRLKCAAAFAYLLGAFMLQRIGGHRLVGMALAAVSAIGVAELADAVIRPVQIVQGPRGPVALLNSDTYEYFAWVARSARPGDRLFGDPDLNFVLELKNPSKLPWVEADAYVRPGQVRALLDTLNQFDTRFIVCYDDTMNLPGPGDNLQPWRTYVKEHYQLAQRFGNGMDVFVRNTARQITP